MLGILITNTSAYPNIEKDEYQVRMREFAKCISSVVDRIKIPKEIIIVDNSIPETIKSEKLLKNMPCPALVVRSNFNPGKEIGDMVGIRDGIALSYSRGHQWLLKISGRYFINREWDIASDLEALEKSNSRLLLPLTCETHTGLIEAGKQKLADLLKNQKMPLIAAPTAAFIISPVYALQNGFLSNYYLYQNIESLELPYKFFHAVRDTEWKRWDNPPIDGKIGKPAGSLSFEQLLKKSVCEMMPSGNKYKKEDYADLTRLLEAVSHIHQ